MKALLTKDIYVMWKQMKIFFLLILVFSVVPAPYLNIFAILYVSMLPYTTIAYDERSKWDQLAAMMPYSARDLVLSKYVFGWISIAVVTLFSGLFHFVLNLMPLPFSYDMNSLPVLFASLGFALFILAFNLPLMFRFGVEKGRLVMFLMIFMVCGGAGFLVPSTIIASSSFSLPPLLFFPVVILLSALSVALSIRFYQNRQ